MIDPTVNNNMELILIAALAFWLGARFRAVFDRMLFREILKDLGVTEQQLRRLASRKQALIDDPEDTPENAQHVQPRDRTEIRIEQHQGQLFAWRVSDGQFMAQGADREGLFRSLEARFGASSWIVKKDEGADLIREG